MLLTLRQVNSGPASRVSGLVPGSKDFINYVNDACRQLMRRASYWSTVQPMEGCIRNGYITWPRTVASVLALNVCGQPVEIRNFWYRFLNYDSAYGTSAFWNWQAQSRALEFDGTIPVFNPVVCSTGMYLLFYPSSSSDIGKTITIYGIDGNGQIIRSKRNDGTYQDGVVVSLVLPYAKTPYPIRKVTRVVKQETNTTVRGYQWDGIGLNTDGSPNVLDLATYDASETNPEYQHARFLRHCGSGGACNTKITALVKLEFVPVAFLDDLVIIENQDALRDMIISIRKKEQGDIASSVQYEKSAMRELNYETHQRWPWEQTNVSFRPFGNDSFHRITAAVNRG